MWDTLLDLFKLAANACGTTTGVFPSLWDGLCSGGGTDPQIDSIQDALRIVANAARILIAGSGGVAVIVILVASIYYVASLGDPGRIKKAKDILTNMGIGLVIIIGAYAILTSIAAVF